MPKAAHESDSHDFFAGNSASHVPHTPISKSPDKSCPIPIRRVQSFDTSSFNVTHSAPDFEKSGVSISSSSPTHSEQDKRKFGKHSNRVASVPNLRAARFSHNSLNEPFLPNSHAHSLSSSPSSGPHGIGLLRGGFDGQLGASPTARIKSPISNASDSLEPSGIFGGPIPTSPILDVVDSVWVSPPRNDGLHTPEYSEEFENTGPSFSSPSDTSPTSGEKVNIGFPRISSLSLQGSPPTADLGPFSLSVPDSPPKTRSNIALPPRSGYSLSDDSDSLRSEGDASPSEGRSSTESSDENEMDGAAEDEDDVGQGVGASEERIRKWQMLRTMQSMQGQNDEGTSASALLTSKCVDGDDDTSNDADAEDEREERVLRNFGPLSPQPVDDDPMDMAPEQDDVSESLEDGLSSLERIFLFAKSDLAYHRVLVSRCLADWIRDVDLTDAVEYVIPLLNGLATDELEVSAVFAPELGRLMWFFFRNCPLQELLDVVPSTTADASDKDEEIMPRPCISVSTFTPLLCSLLLNPNSAVSGATQASIVEYFLRSKHFDEAMDCATTSKPTQKARMEEVSRADLVEMGTARDDKLVPLAAYEFGHVARQAILNELFEHVAIAISCMDENPIDASASHQERLSFDEESALGRMMSVNLLAAITVEGGFSRQQLASRVVPEITNWPLDPAFFVRKEVAAAIGIIGKALVTDADDGFVLHETNAPVQLFDAINRVLLDHVWQVRQAACYSLPGVFATQPRNAARRENLVLIMRALRQDVSPNVQLAAFEMIGEIIYLCYGDEGGVPGELVRLFMGQPMDDSEESEPMDIFANSDYALIVAFNFPAVMLTLGAEHWPRLRELYMRLSTHMYDNVRNSLAASLHEMAKLIGPEAACRDLVTVSEQFLHDSCIDVTSTVLEHMDVFWLILPVDVARDQIRRVSSLWLSAYAQEWRLRQTLAAHIPALVPTMLLTDEDGCLVTLLLLALNDPVNALRDIGVNSVPITYHTFREHDETIADGFISMLCDLSHAPACRQRTTFLRIVQALLEHGLTRNKFESLILPCLLGLAADSVADVNIALARTLKQVWSAEWYTAETVPMPLQRAAATLLNAPLGTVREILQHLEPSIPTDGIEPVTRNESHALEFGPARPLLDNTIIPLRSLDDSAQASEVLS